VSESGVPSMHLTVAICTWNRAELLRRTLEQLRRLEPPPDASWELIVVNNNCTDNTDAVLEEFLPHLPLQRVFEAEPGLSNARNAAIRAASGSFIIWTDDDVLVSPTWLRAYAESMRLHPDGAIFGGPIEPWFDGTPPRWLERGFRVVEGAYAAQDVGRQEAPITADNLPFGANMVVRRELQIRHPFDPNLGRAPGSMLGCEELKVLGSILRQGGTGWWVPDAHVRHFIPRPRQNLRYLLRYWRGNGLSAARLNPAPGRFRMLGSPAWLWRDATMSTVLSLVGLIAHAPDRWLGHMRKAAVSWGRLQGTWQRN
jgi:glucosyl-dolichyl phosphate glucuronosyltransferase